MMISVVDDDPSVRRALKRLLRSLGYDVQTFSSGNEFLASNIYEKLECLILDIHLVGMSGFELRQKLASKGENPPVIFITAHHDQQTQEQALRTGAVAYLRKPFDDQSLIEAIQKATNQGT